jgi:prepilin-type N-terminal cleavage/methylation domain-containing protein
MGFMSRSAIRVHSARPAPRASRLGQFGFTLTEIVVALLLLASGALALVAASAGTIRAVRAAEAQERATMAARDRVEQLASGGCSGLQHGSAVDSVLGLRERWTVTPTRNGVRLVTDTVEHIDPAMGRAVILHRLVLC